LSTTAPQARAPGAPSHRVEREDLLAQCGEAGDATVELGGVCIEQCHRAAARRAVLLAGGLSGFDEREPREGSYHR